MRFVSDIVFISIPIKESKRDKNLKLSMHVPTSPLSLSLLWFTAAGSIALRLSSHPTAAPDSCMRGCFGLPHSTARVKAVEALQQNNILFSKKSVFVPLSGNFNFND